MVAAVDVTTGGEDEAEVEELEIGEGCEAALVTWPCCDCNCSCDSSGACVLGCACPCACACLVFSGG